MTDMVETKMDEGVTDPLEASFAAFEAAGTAEEQAAAGDAKVKRAEFKQAAAVSRPVLGGEARGARQAGGSAFAARYLRRGLDAGLEMKAMSSLTGSEGGYAVPREIDAAIDALLSEMSPIRGLANVVSTGTSGYRKLVSVTGTPSGWVGESAARPETDTPELAEIVPPSGELYANPAASQAMLDDAMFDVEGWLAGEIAREFAVAEGAAFVGGDGLDKPRGFLNYPASSAQDGLRAFGTLQYLATGADGDFGFDGAELLIDLVQTLKSPYRQGAAFVMNSATLGAIRKMKTADGAFLFQPSLAEGRPDTLLGYPVVEAGDMPDIAAGSLGIAFGNFRAGYVIADRGETAILRDPFTNKPFVHFYATKRVGGAVTNSEAIKLVKFGVA